jgi:hypothetical protein
MTLNIILGVLTVHVSEDYVSQDMSILIRQTDR